VTLLVAVLAASLVGSPHCAGMCGPFVCFYAAGPRTTLRSHAAYNLGRLASYVLLGALAGALGARLNAAGELAGVSRTAAIASGTLMVAWGLSQIAGSWGLRIPNVGAPPALQRAFGAVLQRLRERPQAVRAAATGLLTTLLPCGWLYAFVATAAGSGSAATGMLVMATFWVGTLPALLAVGAGVQHLAGPLARRLPAISAAVLVALGLLSISGRLSIQPHVRARLDVPSMHGMHAPAVRQSGTAHGTD
jgi:sulfite exporter TauE/SafE